MTTTEQRQLATCWLCKWQREYLANDDDRLRHSEKLTVLFGGYSIYSSPQNFQSYINCSVGNMSAANPCLAANQFCRADFCNSHKFQIMGSGTPLNGNDD